MHHVPANTSGYVIVPEQVRRGDAEARGVDEKEAALESLKQRLLTGSGTQTNTYLMSMCESTAIKPHGQTATTQKHKHQMLASGNFCSLCLPTEDGIVLKLDRNGHGYCEDRRGDVTTGVIRRHDVTRGIKPGSYVFKWLIVGNPGVGKTSLVERYVKGVCPTNYKPTLGGKSWHAMC